MRDRIHQIRLRQEPVAWNLARKASTKASVKKQAQEAMPGEIRTQYILSFFMVLPSARKNTRGRMGQPRRMRHFRKCHMGSCGRIRQGLCSTAK